MAYEVKQANGGAPSPRACPDNRLYVPAELRPQVIHWAHTSLLSCHPGVKRTMVCHLPEILVAVYGTGGPGVHRGLFGLRSQQDIIQGPHWTTTTTPHPIQTLVGHLFRLCHRAPRETPPSSRWWIDSRKWYISLHYRNYHQPKKLLK